MAARRKFFFLAWSIASGLAPALAAQQPPLAPAAARILLLPKRIVSGERATLAVLDTNGRLAPGVAIHFSNGDHLRTDATGRALFVAPLDPGVIFGSIEGRPGRVSTMILTPAEAKMTPRSEEHTSELQSLTNLVCRLLLEKKKKTNTNAHSRSNNED